MTMHAHLPYHHPAHHLPSASCKATTRSLRRQKTAEQRRWQRQATITDQGHPVVCQASHNSGHQHADDGSSSSNHQGNSNQEAVIQLSQHGRDLQESGAMSPQHGKAPPSKAPSRLLHLVNELTKWVVSATAFGIMLWRRDLAVVWCILGSLVNVVLCKVLKRIINQQRPLSARKEDPGMPSSHASSLSYLAVYCATAIVTSNGQKMFAAAVLTASLFMAWLRVTSGYHTMAQVVVGFLLGSSTAMAWHRFGEIQALAWLQQHPAHVMALYAITAAAVAIFALKNLLGAQSDFQRMRMVMQ